MTPLPSFVSFSYFHGVSANCDTSYAEPRKVQDPAPQALHKHRWLGRCPHEAQHPTDSIERQARRLTISHQGIEYALEHDWACIVYVYKRGETRVSCVYFGHRTTSRYYATHQHTSTLKSTNKYEKVRCCSSITSCIGKKSLKVQTIRSFLKRCYRTSRPSVGQYSHPKYIQQDLVVGRHVAMLDAQKVH